MKLEKMTLADLRTFLRKVESQIPKTEAREKAALRAEFAQIAEARGLRLSDMMDEVGRAKSKPRGPRVIPVKYRNPANPEQQWSGRGRRPHWFDPQRAEHFAV